MITSICFIRLIQNDRLFQTIIKKGQGGGDKLTPSDSVNFCWNMFYCDVDLIWALSKTMMKFIMIRLHKFGIAESGFKPRPHVSFVTYEKITRSSIFILLLWNYNCWRIIELPSYEDINRYMYVLVWLTFHMVISTKERVCPLLKTMAD